MVESGYNGESSRSPMGEASPSPRQEAYQRQLLYSRSPEQLRAQASGSSGTAASLFTIDSILAPRPMGNVAAAAAAAAASLAAMQGGETAAGARTAAAAAAAMHPLQQQLHHLAFTSADFLGEWMLWGRA